MKKLMIVAAFAMAAIATQAAGYSWKAGSTGNVIWDGTASKTLYASDSGALLELWVCADGTGAATRQSIFNDLKAGKEISGNYTSTSLTTASKVTQVD